jgi:creatinine amidohydrolase
VGNHLYAKLRWSEVNDAVRQDKVIIVPVGAIEQHGPHLPIDTDNLIVGSICEEAAARASDRLLCAPPVHYGFNEHNMDFPGTINVWPGHFTNYCFDVAESLARQGFRNIVFVNGHGSNAILLEVSARLTNLKTNSQCASLSYWSLLGDVVSQLRESPYPGGMAHACELETSLYLFLSESDVDMSKAVKEINPSGSEFIFDDLMGSPPVKYVDHWSKHSRTGIHGDPTLATREKGKAFFECAVESLVRVCDDMKKADFGIRRNHLVTDGDL